MQYMQLQVGSNTCGSERKSKFSSLNPEISYPVPVLQQDERLFLDSGN